MKTQNQASKLPPGTVRDAITTVLERADRALSISEILEGVNAQLGETPESSVRSYLRLNTPKVFTRESRGRYGLRGYAEQQKLDLPLDMQKAFPSFAYGKTRLYFGDCLEWLSSQSANSFHAVVTDPPYGLHEYSDEQISKLRNGRGGVWRIPPSFDGTLRSPLPRFTTLTPGQLQQLAEFFYQWAMILLPRTVPGAHVVVASNPLLSYLVSNALSDAGFERRGEIVRLTMTMRGGDRPKSAHEEFNSVSVMPRSMWEPWLVYRRPIEGRVQDNLRKWKTGGFRRPSPTRPFGDVIASAPTRKAERDLAPHPSLKPQSFLRYLVRAVLPLGEGVVLDPFAGSGSTLAAAEAIGYRSVGIERDRDYFTLAKGAIPKLAKHNVNASSRVCISNSFEAS